MKAFIALWIARRLGIRARDLRRALRDHQRHEHAKILEFEHRSRGLRLYAAWIRNTPAPGHRVNKTRPPLPNVTEGTFHAPEKIAA